MKNNIEINSLNISLITKTKEIQDISKDIDNVIQFNGYTDKVQLQIDNKTSNTRIEAKHNMLFIYEENELIAEVSALAISNDSLVRHKTLYDDTNSIITFDVNTVQDIDMQINFSILSNNKVFHIDSIKYVDYWFDTQAKEIFTMSDGIRHTFAKHSFVTQPAYAPRVLSSSCVAYAERDKVELFSINSDYTLTSIEKTDYAFLTPISKELYIGVCLNLLTREVRYDLLSYSNSQGIIVHDTYAVIHDEETSMYHNFLPIVTSVDDSGRNLNISLVSNFAYDLNLDAYYSTTVDMYATSPKFNFGTHSKGRVKLKEGMSVYYDPYSGKMQMYNGVQKTGALHLVFSHTSQNTMIYPVAFGQITKPITIYSSDPKMSPHELCKLYNSCNSTAYSLTISNREGTQYEYIDFTIPRFDEIISPDNTQLMDENSMWTTFGIEEIPGLFIYSDGKVRIKGEKGLYRKRYFSSDLHYEYEYYGNEYHTIYTSSDKQPYTQGMLTSDNIDIHFDDKGITLENARNIIVHEKVDALPVIVSLDATRKVQKTLRYRIDIDTTRQVVKKINLQRIRGIKRLVVKNAISYVRFTRRRIIKSIIKDYQTYRKVILTESVKKLLDTTRRIALSQKKKLRTNRKVSLGYEDVCLRLDTKLITVNTFKPKFSTTRKTSINKTKTILHTYRPVVWCYRPNDVNPIDLDVIRTVHKSTATTIKSLRRVEHDFAYTTSLSTSRNISTSSNSSIDSIRQVLKEISSKINSKRQLIKNYNLYSDTLRASSVYTNGSILTIRKTSLSDNLNIMSNRQVVDYGHCKSNTIRRISKDNCICCNALTNRKVINDLSTAFNTIRTATTTNEADINTNRLIAINYISGYAFTKRHIITPTINSIDLYRYTTNMANPQLSSLRKITVYDWFYNPTTRHITNEANRSYLTNRKAVNDIFVSQDTSRSICNKIELNLDNNREIIKSIDRDIDVKRKVAGEISKEIDVTKKVVEKYIYLNKGQRQIIKSIEQDIDSYREINKLLIANIDTIREVKSENITDTLCIELEFKHGSLWEVERYFYKA